MRRSDSLVQEINVGVRNAESNSTSNHRSLLGLAVNRDYPEDGSIFVRKCHTRKVCCHTKSKLIITTKLPRSRPYQPEAFEPSGPGWVCTPDMDLEPKQHNTSYVHVQCMIITQRNSQKPQESKGQIVNI